MKNRVLQFLVGAVLSIGSVQAQGQVNFATKMGTNFFIKFLDPTGQPATTPPFVAGLQVMDGEGNFVLIPGSIASFRSDQFAGYIWPITVTVPGHGIGINTTLRVVAFEGASEADFDHSSIFCFSNPVSVTLGGGTVIPPNLDGLSTIYCIPEPSPFVIGLFGATALTLLWKGKEISGRWRVARKVSSCSCASGASSA
jgi:hypothetical protein